MAAWPSSVEGELNIGKDVLHQNELSVGMNRLVQIRNAQTLPSTSSWLPSNGSGPSFPAHGFNMPPVNHSSIPSFFELAMYQQAMEQQARLQMTNQALVSRRGKTPHGTMYPTEEDQAQMAMHRLLKKRRVSTSSILVSNSKGSRSGFPMPRPDGYIPTISLHVFRQAWEFLEDRARSLFSNDIDKQREYVKWRYLTFLRRSRISLSHVSIRKGKESAP
jgi:hypothetical protein